MARTSTIVWSLIGAVVAVLGILALVYGPGLYSEGKALVGPIVEMAQSEQRLAALNDEMPFEEPAEGVVAEDRLLVFLEIRRDLEPTYLEWQDMERKIDQQQNEQDLETVKEVLAAVREIMARQIQTLSDHGMSPSEFLWIEDLAYITWLGRVGDLVETSAVAEKLRETTEDDLNVLAELERRHGPSRATTGFSQHLKERIDSLDNPEPPAVDGVTEETAALFWTHRQELMDLDLRAYSEMHSIIRGNNVDIQIDGESE